MSRGPEFVDDAAGPDDGHPDDLLEPDRPGAGRWHPLRRHPALRQVSAGAVAGLVVVAAVVSVVPHGRVVPGRGSSAVQAVATGPASPAADAIVRGLARSTGRLTDYVRQTSAAGACPTVPVGSSPTRAITRAVRAALPEFAITDVASTLDEFTGLCSVRLRARATNHAVLAVVVSAPSSGRAAQDLPFVRLRVGTDGNADGSSTVWVAATTVRHWSVVVGAVGSQDTLPSSATLQRLAQQDDLTW